MTISKLTAAILAACLCGSGAQLHAGEPNDADIAFSALSALVGSWKRDGTDGSRFRIEFELTANDSVLVERWINGGNTHSLTVYYRDGETLLATHYCPQGNQPRLRMEAGGNHKRISFDFYDATNLKGPDHSHQHRLSFDLSSMEHVVRAEAYRQGQTSKQSQMALVRIP